MGATCLNALNVGVDYLTRNGKLDWDNMPPFTGPEAKRLVMGLADGGSNGAEFTLSLAGENKLNWADMPKFNGEEIKRLVMNLADSPKKAAFILSLANENKLDLKTMPKFTKSEAEQLVSILFDSATEGESCLELLLNSNKIPAFDASQAKQLALDLISRIPHNVGETDISFFRKLFEKDILKNLKLEGVDTEDVKATFLNLLRQNKLSELEELFGKNPEMLAYDDQAQDWYRSPWGK